MQKLAALGFSMVILGLFYGLFFLAFWLGTNKKLRQELLTPRRIAIFAGCSLVLLLLVAWVLSQYQFVYFWDYGGYWSSSYQYVQQLFADPAAAADSLYASMNHSDYNLLLPAIIALPLRFFGYTFKRYVFINCLMFLIPIIFILTFIFGKIYLRRHSKINNRAYAVILLSAFTCTLLFAAMLMGYIDIACLLPISLLFLLLLDFHVLKLDTPQLLRNALVALLLVFTLLFRRYFAFFLVSFSLCLAIKAIYELYQKRQDQNFRKMLRSTILSFMEIAAVAIVILFLFFLPLVLHITTNNYSEQYVGYNGPLTFKIWNLIGRLGIIPIILALLGIILCFVRKTHRGLCALATVMILLTVTLFFRVQRMDQHHVYTLAIPFIALIYLGVSLLAEYRPKFTVPLLSVILCFGVINFTFLRIPLAYGTARPDFYRNDIATLHELVDYVNQQNSTQSPVYVLASGPTFNGAVLEALDRPHTERPILGQVSTNDVDLRDGFPTAFLDAKYVITTDTVQLHLAEGSQEVIRYLWQELSDPQSSVGRHFRRLEQTFLIDENITVYVYERTSAFRPSDLSALAEYYDTLYPNQPELFSQRILRSK